MGSTKRTSLLGREIGKSGDFASAEEEAYLSLLRTTSLLERQFEQLFREHDLSESLYNVLRIAAGHGEKGVPTLTIARQLIALVPDVTRLVDRLEKAKLLQRERCEKDRRVVYVKITAGGQKKLEALRKPGEALLHKLLGHLGKANLEELIRLLETVRMPHVSAELKTR